MGALWARFGYRPWARLLHRFDLHHTKRIGPIGDGEIIHKCEWCGISRKEVPMWLTARWMRTGARPTGGDDRWYETLDHIARDPGPPTAARSVWMQTEAREALCRNVWTGEDQTPPGAATETFRS
jgi:hypothetical protein